VEEEFQQEALFHGRLATRLADAKGGLFRVSAPLRVIGNGKSPSG